MKIRNENRTYLWRLDNPAEANVFGTCLPNGVQGCSSTGSIINALYLSDEACDRGGIKKEPSE
jgi:hypothetical protein